MANGERVPINWDEMTDQMRQKVAEEPAFARKCWLAFLHLRYTLSTGSQFPSANLWRFVDEMHDLCEQELPPTQANNGPVNEPIFVRASDIKFRWWEEEVCFDCPCGVTEIVLSEGEKQCDCGRTYRVRLFVEVNEKPNA